MKKQFLFIAFLFVYTITKAQCSGYVYIPDANFKTTLVNDTTINTNDDTEISCSEAANFSGTLDVSNKSIADLTGIEAFTSITILSCQRNDLTTLDLSYNTSLFILQCYGNNLTELKLNTNIADVHCNSNQLTSLDLSKNTALRSLYCSSNKLTSLSLTNNTELQTLNCTKNNLTNLNLSKNTALRSLYCYENELTTLNVTNTSISTAFHAYENNLTCIQVDDAAYSTANWPDIDATASFSENCNYYVEIPDANFKSALVEDTTINTDGDTEISFIEAENYVGTISVSSKSIDDLTGIEAFINITHLRCANNSLTNLGLSKNTKLTQIYCASNKITNLDLTHNTAITFLSCESNELTSIDITQNIDLQIFYLESNKLTSLNVSHNTNLQRLHGHNNDLTSLNLTNNTRLTTLECNNNSLTTLNLTNNTSLTTLECNNNNLTELDLTNNTRLFTLYCSNNSIRSLDLSKMGSLRSFRCSNNNLNYLNISNGNNTNFLTYSSGSNPDLTCIQVDDAEYSTANWTGIDDASSFSENCPTTKWLGTINNDWHTTTNWSTNIVPTTTDDVEIPSGLTNYPTVSAEIAVNSISLLNNATLLANATINTSNVTYSKTLTENWYLATSPLSGETFNNLITNNTFATGTDANIGIGVYNNNGGDAWSYKSSDATGTIDTSLGISLKLATAGDVVFSGNINTTTVTYPITTGGRTNFNLIGNPFTSYINSETFINSNTLLLKEKTIWVWNGSKYETYNLANTTEIAPTHAFFIEASADGIISFDYDNQSHATTDTAAKQEAYSNIELSVNTLTTKLFFIEGKTAGFDNGYDSSLFTDAQNDFTLYTKLVEDDNSGKKLAIQTLGNTNLESMIIPVGINAKAGNELNFSIKTLNLEAGLSVYLEDKIKGTFIDLNNNDYKTTIETDIEASNNYSLHLSAKSLSTQDNSITSQNIIIYKDADNKITVTGLQNDATLKVYSLLGNIVAKTSLVAYGNNIFSLPTLNTGIYIVKINSVDGEKTKKIILE